MMTYIMISNDSTKLCSVQAKHNRIKDHGEASVIMSVKKKNILLFDPYIIQYIMLTIIKTIASIHKHIVYMAKMRH